jgi:hypothetical protein
MAIALVCVVAGCKGNGGPAADGPLSSGSSMHGPIPGGSECVPGGRPVAFGLQTFTNYGSNTVVLDHVVLLHPHNERLVGSFAVPGARVLGEEYWPVTSHPGQPNWRNRQPVHGFRLEPGRAFNMVLGIAALTPARATSQGMLVYYHDSSGSYVAKNFWANIISANTHKCA